MEITDELLAAYAEGNVSTDERDAVRQYLVANPDELESVMIMMDDDYELDEVETDDAPETAAAPDGLAVWGDDEFCDALFSDPSLCDDKRLHNHSQDIIRHAAPKKLSMAAFMADSCPSPGASIFSPSASLSKLFDKIRSIIPQPSRSKETIEAIPDEQDIESDSSFQDRLEDLMDDII